MRSDATSWVKAGGIAAIGLALGVGGVYLSEADDAPGAALLGILMMIGALVLAVRTLRRRT